MDKHAEYFLDETDYTMTFLLAEYDQTAGCSPYCTYTFCAKSNTICVRRKA